jgi:2'-5' RNA ligase
VRLFLALDLGDECRRQIADMVDTIRASTGGIRWVRDEKLHITMSFLGEVDESRIPEISVAVGPLVARREPFTVTVTGSGVFPDWRRVRVVWFGLRDGGGLAGLGEDMRAMRATLGFPPDRPFRAHLTIGRSTGPLSAEQKTSLSKVLATFKAAYPFDVTRVVLMRSAPSRAGSEYTELASFPLRGA